MGGHRPAIALPSPRRTERHRIPVSTLFISHSSRDKDDTLALVAWLAQRGLTDVFLDFDAGHGIDVGDRWMDALRRAGERCEAVVVLISEAWLDSSYCMAEYLLARFTNKRIFGLLMAPGLAARLPDVITADTQLCTLRGDGPGNARVVFRIEGTEKEAWFLQDGLARFERGLEAAGLGDRLLPWPPAGAPDRPPFRGLQPLDREDAAVFFGRDAEIAQCRQLMRGLRAAPDERLLVLVAGSGSGKSSFLRAGLLPRLERDSAAFIALDVIRPQGAAITGDQGLARSLAAAARRLGDAAAETGEFKARLATGSDVLSPLLLDLRTRSRRGRTGDTAAVEPATVVIAIDQAEELFAPGASTAEATRLLDQLGAAVRHGLAAGDAGRAPIVVFAIRADQFEHLRTAAGLQGLKMRVFDGLRPMDRAQFKDVIVRPAEVSTAAGHPLALDPELVQALLDDSEGAADALPLLAVTLGRLLADFGAGGRLTLAHYAALGGLKAIVAHEAESALSPDPDTRLHELAALRDAFIPWLVRVDPESGRCARRIASPAELPARSRAVIAALVSRKLLLADERDGLPTIEVAHEALLGQWPPLVAWIAEVRAELALQQTAEREAGTWLAAGRPAASLWQHERQVPLFAALARLRVERDKVDEPLRSFLRPECERLLDELALPETGHARRVVIGERLAAIGDPRPGVGLRADGLPDLAWCEIPAVPADWQGPVEASTDDPFPGADETSADAMFFIARYAVTRAQFAAFRQARAGSGLAVQAPDTAAGNLPATGVSYDDAAAFCAWAGAGLGYTIGLPGARQRCWAACSAVPGQQFPWGPRWDAAACNSAATGLAQATSVGMYPAGASRQQAFDLAGNVWEWTRSPAPFPDRRLLAGGSWYGSPATVEALRITAADRSYRGDNVGFRVICARPGSRSAHGLDETP